MSTLGTFDSFTTARLGIYAAQHGLHITGNNISNINTDRYTRQRVDQVSFKTGSTDRYASWTDNHMGSGVLVSGISQIRDPFLDIRYRTTSTDTYYYDSRLSGLQSIATILDEVGDGTNEDGLIYAQLQDVLKMLRAFSANPTSGNDSLVRESANSLTALFRHYANKLDELYENSKAGFNNSITSVNEMLTNIRDLNESIRNAEIHGDMALEMRDERNRQIDELSKYMSIRVEYSYEDVGAGVQVEKLTIRMDNSNPDKNVHTDESILVDGVYATQLSVPDEKPVINTQYDPSKYNPDDPTTEIYRYLYLKGDGTGTNSVEEANKVRNDNFTVQLGQLLDRKGKVWESTSTTWTPVQGKKQDDYAVFEFPINVTGLSTEEGKNKFGITQADGTVKNYVIGTAPNPNPDPNTIYVDINDISKDGATVDSEKFAAFLMGELKKSGKYDDDYDISVTGNNIVFTALNKGEPAADKIPALNDDPEDNGLFDVGKMVTSNPGYIYVAPGEKTTETDAYGNTTTVKYVQSGDQWYKVTIETKHTYEIALDDNDLHGILQAQREMLTEEGEFASKKDVEIDENACIKRGIPYYIKSLDLLAQKFAEAYNSLNTGFKVDQNGNYLDENNNIIPNLGIKKGDVLTDQQKQNLIDAGYYLKDKNGNPVDEHGYPVSEDNKVADLDAWLLAQGAVRMGGPLFSNRNDGNDTAGINAHNIDISAGWSNGEWGIVPKFEVLVFADGEEDVEHSTQNTNADHMISLLMDKALTYDPRDLYGSDAIGPVLFEGTFNDMLSNMMGVEAEDERITNVRLMTNDIALTELDYSREGVSGVDLNDEAMNMVTYQKAMNAAMRLMTAIDEALDRLINNTGVAGR